MITWDKNLCAFINFIFRKKCKKYDLFVTKTWIRQILKMTTSATVYVPACYTTYQSPTSPAYPCDSQLSFKFAISHFSWILKTSEYASPLHRWQETTKKSWLFDDTWTTHVVCADLRCLCFTPETRATARSKVRLGTEFVSRRCQNYLDIWSLLYCFVCFLCYCVFFAISVRFYTK